MKLLALVLSIIEGILGSTNHSRQRSRLLGRSRHTNRQFGYEQDIANMNKELEHVKREMVTIKQEQDELDKVIK